jgi:hypothetical protein
MTRSAPVLALPASCTAVEERSTSGEPLDFPTDTGEVLLTEDLLTKDLGNPGAASLLDRARRIREDRAGQSGS